MKGNQTFTLSLPTMAVLAKVTSYFNWLVENRPCFKAGFFENENQWAKLGKSRLQHVQADKAGQQQPGVTIKIGEQGGEQNHHTCKSHHSNIDIHGVSFHLGEVSVTFFIFRSPSNCNPHLS